MNVTMTLEDEVVRKVRKIAAERDTTLTGLVREYLIRLSDEDGEAESLRRVRAIANMDRAFEQFRVQASPRTWSRAELYERK